MVTAIRSVVLGQIGDPSPTALLAHIADLEQDVRNIEFRLQFLYHNRLSALDLLAIARRQAEKLKK